MTATVGARRKDNVLWGKVNGVEKRILVDTGAEVGMIPRSLVGRDAIDCVWRDIYQRSVGCARVT